MYPISLNAITATTAIGSLRVHVLVNNNKRQHFQSLRIIVSILSTQTTDNIYIYITTHFVLIMSRPRSDSIRAESAMSKYTDSFISQAALFLNEKLIDVQEPTFRSSIHNVVDAISSSSSAANVA